MKEKRPVVITVRLNYMSEVDRNVSLIKGLKSTVLNLVATGKPYHDFYNDPNQ